MLLLPRRVAHSIVFLDSARFREDRGVCNLGVTHTVHIYAQALYLSKQIHMTVGDKVMAVSSHAAIIFLAEIACKMKMLCSKKGYNNSVQGLKPS